MNDSFNKTPKQVLEYFNVNPTHGLTKNQVAANEAKYGRNELKEDPPTPLWELIMEQFKDQLVIILLVAAVISFVLAYLETEEQDQITAYVEPLVILLILFANATVGVVQESNAEKAIGALKEYSPDEAKVLRDGHLDKIAAFELVPGDIVHLSVGDKVPADCRLLEVQSSCFRVDQSILTGESVSVLKEANAVVKDKKAVKQDQVNCVFSGTTITIGKATAIVTAIGEETAIGDIHKSISSQIEEKTPLKVALDDFGDQLAKIITVICILVWLINVRHFNDEHFHGNWVKGAVYYFKIAVALAVAAIPEGLAVIITTCLALGTKRMATQGAIVRKLRSVETLGCTSVICSDKTGTLTTNQMSVRRIFTVDSTSGKSTELRVEGSTYGPEGRIYYSDTGSYVDRDLVVDHPVLQQLVNVAILCNDSKVVYDQDNDSFFKIGEPTEAALVTMCEKLGTDDAVFNKKIPFIADVAQLEKMSRDDKEWRISQVYDHVTSKYKKLATLEFSRDRKSMSVLVQGNKKKQLLVKGAPEAIIDRCKHVLVKDGTVPLTAALKKQLLERVNEWADDEALRVLGFAFRDNVADVGKLQPDEYIKAEQDMTFVGLVGMLDPPRAEVLNSIKLCKQAGVRVVVITGDNQKTAESICKQIGVFSVDEDLTGKSFTGREFDQMSLKEKQEAIRHADLFSRTEPSHKQLLVDMLKAEGWIVAMTGDGVNDAPALKKADIGIAMGSGTDVAKLASDMVLADDNFATIVSAVEEGRSIYSNTKQFIRYLISSNIGEVVSIFLTVLLGMPEALIPVQLLWVNLVTDGLPATALGFNPADNDIMRKPPRDAKEAIVTPWLFIRYMIVGVFVGCATIFGYAWWFIYYTGGPQISWYHLTNFHKCSSLFPEIGCEMFTGVMAKKATTMSLSILVVVEMFNAMNSLSENESLLTFPLYKNMYLVGAIILSMLLHIMILYVPFFSTLFSITPLNYIEWKWVVYISAPVLLVDEVLKWVSRNFVQPAPKVISSATLKKQKSFLETATANNVRRSPRKTKKSD